MANRTIRILEDGNPAPRHHRIKTKKHVDTIRWKAEGNGGPWEIVFAETTPIDDRKVDVERGGASEKHSITGIAGDYAYTISLKGSEEPGVDPNIIVQD